MRAKKALISVYNKEGVVELAKVLSEKFGYEIISTGGTFKKLAENGILSGLCLSDDEMLWCATETADVKTLDRAVKLVGEAI